MTGDDDVITLKDAAKLFGFSVSTLRTEADRGRLTIYRIGNRYYTSPADIREMVQQCRVAPKVPTADSVMSDAERTSAAMAAVKEAMLGLRKRG